MHGSGRDSIAVGHCDGDTVQRASLADHLAARFPDDGGKRWDFDAQLVGDQREQLQRLRRLVRPGALLIDDALTETIPAI